MLKDMEQVIREKLQKLAPVKLVIIDDSGRHKGHAGAKEGGQTHFNLEIVSNAFEHKSLVARHKIVYKLLEEELKTQIHALAIKAWTVEEYNEQN